MLTGQGTDTAGVLLLSNVLFDKVPIVYENAGGFVFVGVAVGSLISAGLGYVGFGIEALMPVVLCGIAAYYYGKSQVKDS